MPPVATYPSTEPKEISVDELSILMKENPESIQLLDVRELFERETSHIGGIHIPLSTLDTSIAKKILNNDKPIVVYCRSGGRSAAVCRELIKIGFSNVINLKGGMVSWAQRIDPTLSVG